MAEILVLIVVIILLVGPPFVIGYRVESRMIGLIVLGAVPALVSIYGFVIFLDAESSPDKETRDWSIVALVLPLLSGVALVIGVVAWLIGRIWARRSQKRFNAAIWPDQAIVPGSVDSES